MTVGKERISLAFRTVHQIYVTIGENLRYDRLSFDITTKLSAKESKVLITFVLVS